MKVFKLFHDGWLWLVTRWYGTLPGFAQTLSIFVCTYLSEFNLFIKSLVIIKPLVF